MDSQKRVYWDNLIPEIQNAGLWGDIREVESTSETVHELTKVVRKGRYQTVVAIGDDAFLATVAGALLESTVAVGYIPFGHKINFAAGLNLNSQVGQVGPRLAARRLKRFDLLKVNREYAVGGLQVGFWQERDMAWETAGLLKRKFLRSGLIDTCNIFSTPDVFGVRVQQAEYELSLESIALRIVTCGYRAGRMFSVAPVSGADGYAHLVSVGRVTPMQKRQLYRPLATLEHKFPFLVTHTRLQRCTLAIDTDKPVALDGYILRNQKEFEVQALAAAYSLIV